MNKLEKIIEYGFYLFLFLLPWQTRLIVHDPMINGFTWEYGRISIYGTEILLWIIFSFYIVWLFKTRKFRKISLSNLVERLKKPDILVYWLFVLFVVLAGLSVFWAMDWELAYYRWFRLVEAVAVMSMILMFNFKLHRIAICWISTSALQGVFAIWQFFVQFVFANKWLGLAYHHSTVAGSIILESTQERWLRAYGSLPHPNMLGGFLVIALLFLLYLAFIAKNRYQRFYILFNLIIILPGLFFTFSRSAWIALLVCLAILGGWLTIKKQYLYKKTFFKIFMLMVVLVMILGINLQGPLMTRILGQERLETESIRLRMTFNEQAFGMIKEHPMTGVGIGNYTLGVFNEISDYWPGYYYQPVHNIYLLILTELGIFGIIICGLILGIMVWLLAKNADDLKSVISFLALFSILIVGLFDHYYMTLYFGLIVFFVVVGINLKEVRK